MATSSTKSECPYLVVAAFDFGTTYSGYAFSFRHEPLKVITKQSWIAGSENLISLKTPTCVLVKPDKEFHSFGFEAENKYKDLAEDDNHHDWLLFRRFKMLLYKNEKLSRETTIDDITGKSMKAMPIFTMAIRYLHSQLLRTLGNQTPGIKETDIQYIITVPAIWDDNAKQFMREGAVEAGIDTDRLKLALEPEAASVWCQQITSEAQFALTEIGRQYVVVDLGGGTADISVHEKLKGGRLKELHTASGGSWGGNEVDKLFIGMFDKIFGIEVMEQFKKEQTADYFDILRDFETKKRTITNKSEGKVTFRVSAALKEIYEEEGRQLKEAVSQSGYGNLMTISGDKLRVDISIVKEWFDVPINSLVSHVQAIFQKQRTRDVNTILLVGGFGENEVVQDKFRKLFPNKKMILPNEAGTVVLKGAVRFGHLPDVVSSRVMKYAYGLQMTMPFDSKTHDERKAVRIDGRKLCDDLFLPMVECGDEIECGHTVKHKDCKSLGTEHVELQLYCCSNEEDAYVTDAGCKKLGSFTVELPKGKRQKQIFDVEFSFGETEIKVTVQFQKSKKKFSAIVDCL